MLRSWPLPIVLAGLVSGCGAIGAIHMPSFGRQQEAAAQPTTLAAPTESVEMASLPPPGETDAAGTTDLYADAGAATGDDPFAMTDGSMTTSTNVAAGTPASAVEVGRSDLLGGWTVSSGTESCQLFMTLTTWTGGYRASTRGCASEPLKSIAAWNLNGKQVVLAGEGGTPVARLYGSGENRFDGRTETQGQPIAFFR